MKLYVTDIGYAKAHEAELRKLRMAGNMIAMHADFNRQALMRMYRTLANFYIADHGEFAFSGCYILFNERSANTEKVISILKQNHVRFRFAYPYTNACGGQDVKYESDPSLSNDLYTYVLAFDSIQQKEEVSALLKPYCDVMEDDGVCHLNFHESDWHRALAAIAEHENIDESQIVYLREE
ncbi:MAG: hypothetical protein IKG55_01745 [Solobacterium sp.]|nr:hypothetical protein [Solobacterium sp.]